MTLANQITIARIFLTFVFLAFLVAGQVAPHVPGLLLWSRTMAWALYLIATSTDWIDGFIARRTNTISSFGAMADPLADKLLVASAFIAFVGIKELSVPAWAVYLIVAREFLIMGMRSLAAVRGVTLRAERWGKWKMGIQSVCVVLILTLLVVWTILRRQPLLARPYISPASALRLLQVTAEWPHYLTILAAISAWASGAWYAWHYRDLLNASMEAGELTRVRRRKREP